MSDVTTEIPTIPTIRSPSSTRPPASGPSGTRSRCGPSCCGECPVHAGNLDDRFGVAPFGEAMSEDTVTPHHVLGFDAVQQVLQRRRDVLVVGLRARRSGCVFGHSILEMDEPEHHAYRALIQQAFTRKAMESWEADIVRPDRRRARSTRSATAATPISCSELLFPFPVHGDRRR